MNAYRNGKYSAEETYSPPQELGLPSLTQWPHPNTTHEPEEVIDTQEDVSVQLHKSHNSRPNSTSQVNQTTIEVPQHRPPHTDTPPPFISFELSGSISRRLTRRRVENQENVMSSQSREPTYSAVCDQTARQIPPSPVFAPVDPELVNHDLESIPDREFPVTEPSRRSPIPSVRSSTLKRAPLQRSFSAPREMTTRPKGPSPVAPAHVGSLQSHTHDQSPSSSGQTSQLHNISQACNPMLPGYIPSKEVKQFSGGSGQTAWYRTSTMYSMQNPPVPSDVRVADLWVHSNTLEGTFQAWMYNQKHEWVPVMTGFSHPTFPNRVLHLRAGGVPSWVLRHTLTTYKGRLRKEDIKDFA